MTINLTDVTFDLLVAEQLHDIVPCDWDGGGPSCRSVAHWSLRCEKCADTVTLCGPHRSAVDNASLCGIRIECGTSGHRFLTPIPWVAL